MEYAVAHGYLSATQRGYAEQRKRAHRGTKPSAKHGLTDLARDFGATLRSSVHTGPSPDGPLTGVT